MSPRNFPMSVRISAREVKRLRSTWADKPARLVHIPRSQIFVAGYHSAEVAAGKARNRHAELSQNPRKGFGHSRPVCCLTLPIDRQGGACAIWT